MYNFQIAFGMFDLKRRQDLGTRAYYREKCSFMMDWINATNDGDWSMIAEYFTAE